MSNIRWGEYPDKFWKVWKYNRQTHHIGFRDWMPMSLRRMIMGFYV